MEVRSCHLPTLGLKSRGKGVRAVVSLCQPPGRNELQPGTSTEPGGRACLLVSTMKDKQGTRYKVRVRRALSLHLLQLLPSAGVSWLAPDTAAEQLYEVLG